MPIRNDTASVVPTKHCGRGELCVHPLGPDLPATSRYFQRDAGSPSGWYGQCKLCWSVAHGYTPRPVWDVPDGYKRCSKCGDIKAVAAFYASKTGRYGVTSHCRNCKNKESRRYAKANPEQTLEAMRRYTQSHTDVRRARAHRRRSVVRRLPATFTSSDWGFALEYFNGACAYCCNGASFFDRHYTLHQEHYVPVAAGGGYTPDNIIPACQSCNFSKGSSDSHDWLISRFGKRKSAIIEKRISAYFASVSHRD